VDAIYNKETYSSEGELLQHPIFPRIL